MSEIREYIAEHGADAVAAKLRALPNWRLFNMLWKSPQDIAKACERLGVSTIADLQAWVTASATLPRLAEFCGAANPAAPALPDPVSIPWTTIDGCVQSQCNLHSTFNRMNSDAMYATYPKASLDAIAQACPSHWHRHAGSEQMDCDDFARMALGWLSSVGLGGLAAGRASTVHYVNGSVVYGHACLLVVDAANTVWLWEPQNGKLYPATYARLGAPLLTFPDRVEVMRLDF